MVHSSTILLFPVKDDDSEIILRNYNNIIQQIVLSPLRLEYTTCTVSSVHRVPLHFVGTCFREETEHTEGKRSPVTMSIRELLVDALISQIYENCLDSFVGTAKF